MVFRIAPKAKPTIAVNFEKSVKNLHLVPKRLVRNPKKTERINLPKEAAFTGSSLCSAQWRR